MNKEQRTKHMQGFSLIELMVVIAIVGILAAIAVPVYKNYQSSAKVSVAVGVMDSLIQKAIIYANQHGEFPGAARLLGIGTGGSVFVTSPPSLPNSIKQVESADISTYYGQNSSCGAVGFISIGMNAQLVGLGGTSILWMDCVMAHKNNTVKTSCWYNYSVEASSLVATSVGPWAAVNHPAKGSLIPGWPNTTTPQSSIVLPLTAGSTCM